MADYEVDKEEFEKEPSRFFENESLEGGEKRYITIDLNSIVSTEAVLDDDGGCVLVVTTGGLLKFPRQEDYLFTIANVMAFIERLNTEWRDFKANENKA